MKKEDVIKFYAKTNIESSKYQNGNKLKHWKLQYVEVFINRNECKLEKFFS